jgi:hypothetical protein
MNLKTLSLYHNYAIATAVLRGPPCTCRHPGLHESYLYHALLARMYTQTCCFRNQGTFVLFAPLKPTLDSPLYTLSMVIPLPFISYINFRHFRRRIRFIRFRQLHNILLHFYLFWRSVSLYMSPYPRFHIPLLSTSNIN